MFSGRSPHIGRCTSYATAHALWERRSKTRTGRDRKLSTYGYPMVEVAGGNGHVRWVRKDRANSIRFRLYDTDVVTYREDGSVSLESWPSALTCDFAWSLTPDGIHLNADGTIDLNGRTARAVVCSGSVTLKRVDHFWEVVGGRPKTFTDIRVDRRALRVAALAHNLPDFKGWLDMALIHKGAHRRGNDADFGLLKVRDEFFQALANKQFLAAVKLVPYLSDRARYSFGRSIEGFGADAVDWAKIELHLAHNIGATTTEDHTIIPASTYRSMVRRVKQMQSKGIPGAWTLGW